MIYLDATFFINSVIGPADIAESAKEIIWYIQQGNTVPCTSLLCFDEILYVLKKRIGLEAALKTCLDFFNGPQLIKFVVSEATIAESFDIISSYKLQPRDAIHAATAKLNKLNTIVSDDKDFDSLPWLKRYSIVDFADFIRKN